MKKLISYLLDRLKKLICYLFGHKYFFVDGHENRQSKFKDYSCSRCENLFQSQYDLPSHYSEGQ